MALCKSTSTHPNSAISPPPYPRLALLASCLSATATFYTLWLSLPATMYPNLPVTTLSLAAHASIVLAMLNLFTFDGWDLTHVRQVVPFSGTIEKLAQKYEEGSADIQVDGIKAHPFLGVAAKLRKLVDWHDAWLAGRDQDSPSRRESTAMPHGATHFDFDLEGLNEGFWNDIMTWTGCEEI